MRQLRDLFNNSFFGVRPRCRDFKEHPESLVTDGLLKLHQAVKKKTVKEDFLKMNNIITPLWTRTQIKCNNATMDTTTNQMVGPPLDQWDPKNKKHMSRNGCLKEGQLIT